MNQDCNTVARYVPLKGWRPKLHTKGCPFKELDTQVAVEWTTAAVKHHQQKMRMQLYENI